METTLEQPKVVSASDLEGSSPAVKVVSSADLEGATPVSHGASGGWDEPAWSDVHPTISAIVRPLVNFGQNAVEGAKDVANTPSNLYNAAGGVPAETPGEIAMQEGGKMVGGATGGALALATHRLISQPTAENAKAFYNDLKKSAANQKEYHGGSGSNTIDATIHAIGMVPVVGPTIKSLLDQFRSGDYSGALGKAAGYAVTGEALSEAAGKVAGRPIKPDYSQNNPIFRYTPEGHLRTALNPDLDEAGLKLAGEQLKAGEAKIQTPVKDITTARAAAKAQFQQELMPQRRYIIGKQANVTVPGSRNALVRAKIDAIPADIRPGSPEYIQLVQQAHDAVPQDLTIGELEKINSSLNSQNRAFHQATFSSGLSKLESARGAMDIASEAVTRKLMEDGMTNHGLGGAPALKQINKRIGSLIKLEDSIDKAEGQARVEAVTPTFKRLTVPRASNDMSFKGELNTNERIAEAMRRWESQSPAIQPNMRATPNYTANTRGMPPSNTSGPQPMGPVQNRLNAQPPPAPTASGPMPQTPAFRARMEAYRKLLPGQTAAQANEAATAGKTAAGSPHAMPEVPTQPVHTAGPAIQQMEGPFKGKPIEGEQQRLPGLPKSINPESRLPANPQQNQLFAERQQSPKVVPPKPALLTPNTPLDKTTGYVYHATNEEGLRGIQEDGRLQTFKPNHGTEQDSWPDGATEKRAYFSEKNPWSFAPENGRPVILRVAAKGLQRESTGDLFSTKPIPANQIEYLGEDGYWYKMSNKPTPPPKRTSK